MNKRSILATALGIALGAVAFIPPAAMAADGTITINGQLTAATCSVAVNGGSNGNATVTLPTMQTSDFSTTGTAAGYTPFTIALSGCSAGSSTPAVTKVVPYFEQGPTTDMGTGYLTNNASSNGSNVEVMLSTGNSISTALKLQNPVASQGSTAQSITGGNNPSFTYYASYISAKAAATAGVVNTSVQYDLSYQ